MGMILEGAVRVVILLVWWRGRRTGQTNREAWREAASIARTSTHTMSLRIVAALYWSAYLSSSNWDLLWFAELIRRTRRRIPSHQCDGNHTMPCHWATHNEYRTRSIRKPSLIVRLHCAQAEHDAALVDLTSRSSISPAIPLIDTETTGSMHASGQCTISLLS